MTHQRISGWPVWQLVWVVGTISTMALLLSGVAWARESSTLTTCPAATPSDASVLCAAPITTGTTHPHELRGFLLIALAVVWGIATVRLAGALRPR